jgi:hypothetical protein
MSSLPIQQAEAQQATADQNAFIASGAVEPQKHLTCYPDKDQLYQLWVCYNNEPILTYRAHKTQKHPYFSPMMGPVSGLPLTTESARPYPHHRGIFFGMDRVDAGSETGHSFWDGSLNTGQMASQGPTFAKEGDRFKVSANSAEMLDHCLWQRRNRDPIAEDHRRYIIKVLDKNRYVLDVEIIVKPLTELSFRKTNHGLFAIRVAPDLCPEPYGTATMISSEGRKGSGSEKDPGGSRNLDPVTKRSINGIHGHPARWVAFYGQRARFKEELVEGIAVFCPSKAPHPKFENCPWFARSYGNTSPMISNWFANDETLVLAKGQEVRFRYQVVAFGGTPAEADLNGLWSEFDRAG